MSSPYRDDQTPPPHRAHQLACVLLLACLSPAAWPAGPMPGPAPCSPACPPAGSSFPPCLPPVPARPPRPPAGPESVGELVEPLSNNDAVFEVIVGQGRVLTTKSDLSVRGKPPALIAVGDPSVIEFQPLNLRQIRILGMRLGVTDLAITTPDSKTYNFEVRVVADLHVLRGQLHCLFPDASLKLSQIRDHVVVEGEARDAVQVARILETINAYLISIEAVENRKSPVGGVPSVMPPAERQPVPRPEGSPDARGPLPAPAPPPEVAVNAAIPFATAGAVVAAAQQITPRPRVINLIKVPGSKQVLLKVRVAELNRTAMRQIGADFLTADPIIGTQI